MDPIINIGFISIHWYSVFIFIAILIGSNLAIKEAKKHGFEEDFVVNLLFWGVIFGIIGARLYYVIFNFDYYRYNLLEIFKVWNGGLAIHGGILAKGAGLIKQGENGKGLKSRWYPQTIARRIRDIAADKDKISFVCGDAFDYLSSTDYPDDTYFFIDPPYYVAGKRLYSLSDVNHEELFDCVSRLKCHYLLTYDKNDYILSLVKKHNLQWRTIPMQTTHLIQKEELLISDNFEWL